MRVVLGVSLTAGSAVWVLVDTYDGSIIADEVVPLESVNEIARAAARSVQAFALQSERDIDGVRLVWDDDARQHGIRLRTKLRLFGFETVETVSEDAAREGRNRTARHIAPHMVLAYGAARADLEGDDDKGVLGRLVSRVPGVHPGDRGGGMPTGGGRVAALRTAGSEAALRISDRVRHVGSTLSRPVPAVAAGIALVAVVSGLVGWAMFGGPSRSVDVPDTAVAGAVVPVPPAPAPAMPLAVAPALAPPPQAIQEETLPEVLPEPEQMPEYSTALPETVTDTEVAVDTVEVPEIAETQAPAALAAEVPVVPTDEGTGTVTPAQVTTPTGEPHLTGVGPLAGPGQSAVVPVGQAVPAAQASPATVPPAPVPPAPTGPLGAFLSALP